MPDGSSASPVRNPCEWFLTLTSFLELLPNQSLRMDAGGYDALATIGLPAAQADAAICGTSHRGDVVGERGEDDVLVIRLADEPRPSPWMTIATRPEKPADPVPVAVRVSATDVEVVLSRALLGRIGTHACVEHLGVRRPLRQGWKRALVSQRRRFPATLLPADYPVGDVAVPESEAIVLPPARDSGDFKVATLAQVRFLKGLGYAGPKPADALTLSEASDAIQKLLNDKRSPVRKAS